MRIHIGGDHAAYDLHQVLVAHLSGAGHDVVDHGPFSYDPEDDYPVYVDFDNPGSVQPGAAVRVGGVKVGSVEEVQYLGRRLDPQTGRRAPSLFSQAFCRGRMTRAPTPSRTVSSQRFGGSATTLIALRPGTSGNPSQRSQRRPRSTERQSVCVRAAPFGVDAVTA